MPDFDVVLFLKYNFHHSVLDPVAKELKKLDVNFLITGKRHLVYDMFEETKKKFPVIILADEWTNLFRDCSEILITVGHSPASKNTTLDPKNAQADYIYAFSKFYKNKFLLKEITPKKEIVVTGNPASSRLFRRELDLHSVWSKKMITSKTKILFAPTYNKDLSILDALIKEEHKSELFLQMSNFSIAFKLHPVLFQKYPEHAEFVKSLSEKYSHVYYHDDSHSDITDAILWSDITVGDCSGALLLAIAGGKPVIVYDNPNRDSSEYYDPNGPEWKFRDDYAYRIEDDNLMNLPNLIVRRLENDFLKDRRNSTVDFLFDHQRNSEKVIAQHIAGLLNKK